MSVVAGAGEPQARTSADETTTRRATDAVVVRGLVKRYARRRSWRDVLRGERAQWDRALDGVSFSVAPGEIFGLLGPNGAGKTSLLKILSTLIVPDEGTAMLGGHDVVRDERRARGAVAACLANERSLYWRLTARENLEVFADLVGVERHERDARVRELLEAFGLEQTGRKLVAQFSSGMMQRLVVARALLRRPKVLLLDEPTRSMDPLAARDFRATLRRELTQQRDCAVILATHTTEEALELCDRAAVINKGRILAEGSVEQLGRRFLGVQVRLWTRDAQHVALRALPSPVRVVSVEPAGGDIANDPWRIVTLEGVDGLDAAARLLRDLAGTGLSIARFEFAPMTLARLIDRVLETAPTP